MKRYDPAIQGPCPELQRTVMQECQDGEYVKTEDVLAIIKGCWDYSGGHRSNSEHLEIYHHGMQTVLNAMTGALKAGPNDMQSNVLLAMGRRSNDTGILPNGDPVR